MSEYGVQWSIGVEAESAREAAREALAAVRDPDSLAVVFNVVGPSGHTVEVDLADDARTEAGGGATCRHCGRTIVGENGVWIDPEATGDDDIWRETCDSHDTFTAEHEPMEAGGGG